MFVSKNYIYLAIVVVLFIHIYLRYKYGFWFHQPVFHFYDFTYYLFPPGIIDHRLPEKNRYTNFRNIETYPFDMISDLKMNKFVNFIHLHYLQNKNNTFLPKKENIIPYFTNSYDKSFFSFYYEDIFLTEFKSSETICDKKIISVMTSKPVYVKINNKSPDANFYAYYVDYLCVDKEYRKKGIAPEIIQTHHYIQRHLNSKIAVSIFKREGELTGIVPLCIFSTYAFSVKFFNVPSLLPPTYSIIECNAKNLQYLETFLQEKKEDFDIVINTNYFNILDLINSGNIFIYFIMTDNEICGAYFFRKTCVFVDKNSEALTCFASINSCPCDSNKIFIDGYKSSLYKIIEKHKEFSCAVIENTSHNDIIIHEILLETKPFIISPTAYFFYNFAYPSFKSNKCFIFC